MRDTKRPIFFAAFLLIWALCASAAAAPRGRWKLLGERTVDPIADRDTIMVTGNRGDFRALMFTVQNGTVRFRNMKVYFGNGSATDYPLRAVLSSGQQSKPIDLPGRERIIQRVEFYYASTPGWHGRGKPVVRLYGLD